LSRKAATAAALVSRVDVLVRKKAHQLEAEGKARVQINLSCFLINEL
jgi:hypothetical protein